MYIYNIYIYIYKRVLAWPYLMTYVSIRSRCDFKAIIHRKNSGLFYSSTVWQWVYVAYVPYLHSLVDT